MPSVTPTGFPYRHLSAVCELFGNSTRDTDVHSLAQARSCSQPTFNETKDGHGHAAPTAQTYMYIKLLHLISRCSLTRRP